MTALRPRPRPNCRGAFTAEADNDDAEIEGIVEGPRLEDPLITGMLQVKVPDDWTDVADFR